MNVFTVVLMLPLVLFWTPSHAKVLTQKDRARELSVVIPKLKTSCTVLRQNVVNWWTEMEDSEQIHCLNASYIPETAFNDVVTGFEADCLQNLLTQIQPQLDGRDDLEMRLAPEELQDLFQRHYQPVYDRFCASQNRKVPSQTPDENAPKGTQI